MSSDPEGITDRRLDRKTLLKLGAAAGATGILAGCGASSGSDDGGSAGNTGAEEQRPPIEQEDGNLAVFEWAGYELPTYAGAKAYTGKRGYPKPKYTFLTSDDHALSKVRAGSTFDLVHPCIGYVQDWLNLDAIEAWDVSLMPNTKDLNPEMMKNGQVDGQQYFIPADWGFSAPLYRSDKVDTSEDTWGLFFDEKYKGKISWWDSLENLIVAGYYHGVDDPWGMDASELAEMRDFLISKKHVVRNFWASQTDMDNDFAAGNIWVAYSWAGSYVAAKDAGLEVAYMEPKEGRLSWVCGFVLMKDAPNYHHAHEYIDVWSSTESALWIEKNYAYGHANTAVDLSKLDPEFVELLHLDDPSALQEPNAHMDRYIENRKEYGRYWAEVKAA
jgi:spermidine/putrescine transport system substrate-binding protein